VESQVLLGFKLRELRQERELTQRALAQLAGISPNAVSLIERDEISPSVATLQRLAAALNVKMSYFFENTTLARILHVSSNRRPAIRGAGLTIEGLGSRLDDQQMEPFFITLAPCGEVGSGHVMHAGHEFVCCLTGCVRYEIDREVYTLLPGDSLLFEANLPHRWENPGPEEARLLLVLQAVIGAQEPARQHFADYPSITYINYSPSSQPKRTSK
jgi:transcriptional regulator with XRE-family HTH domain